MEPIKYYKDKRYDHDLFDDCYDYYDITNDPTFDSYQNGYNHLGYDTLTLVNIVWNGTEMVHFFLDDEGQMMQFESDDAEYITCGHSGYRLHPNTTEELRVISHLIELRNIREEYENVFKPQSIGTFKFLGK